MTRCTRCSGDLLDLAIFCPRCGQPHEPDFDQLINRSLSARYTITERLGKGGLSTVFIAYDTHTDQTVVVKVSDPCQLVRHSPPEAFDSTELRHYWMEMLARMRREVVALVNVHHPNIVRIFDTDQITDELRYIVMERLQGQMLREVLTARGRFELPVAIRLTEDIISGLSEVHARGIVHRDLNPRNLLIADCAGQSADSLTHANEFEETATRDHSQSAIRNLQTAIIKIIDFGIARIPQPPGLPPFTQYAVLSGTVAYASPEQCQNLPLDHRSDIYSLGVVLYEMVTGQRPFTGLTPTEIALKQIQSEPVSPRLLVPDLPLGFEAALLRTLAKDPLKRPQTVEELAADLHPFRDGYTARVVVPLNNGHARPAETLAEILGELPHAAQTSDGLEKTAPANLAETDSVNDDSGAINQPPEVRPPLREPHFTTLAPPRRHRVMVATVMVLGLIMAGALSGSQLLSTLQSSLDSAFPAITDNNQPEEAKQNPPGAAASPNAAGTVTRRPGETPLTPTGSAAATQTNSDLLSRLRKYLPGKTQPDQNLAPASASTSTNELSAKMTNPRGTPHGIQMSPMPPPLAQPQMPPVPEPIIVVARDPLPKSSPADAHGPLRDSKTTAPDDPDNGSSTLPKNRRIIQQSPDHEPPLSRTRDDQRSGEPSAKNHDWNRNQRDRTPARDDRHDHESNNDAAESADYAPKVITWSGEVNREREVRLELPGTPGNINIPRQYRKHVGLVEAPGPHNKWRSVVLRVFGNGRTSVVVQWWPHPRQFTQSAGSLLNRHVISPVSLATRAMARQVTRLRR